MEAMAATTKIWGYISFSYIVGQVIGGISPKVGPIRALLVAYQSRTQPLRHETLRHEHLRTLKTMIYTGSPNSYVVVSGIASPRFYKKIRTILLNF